MKINVTISKYNAILAGINDYGESEVEVNIEKLSEEQKKELAKSQFTYQCLVLEQKPCETAVIEMLQQRVDNNEIQMLDYLRRYLDMSQEVFNTEPFDCLSDAGHEALKHPLLDEKIRIRQEYRIKKNEILFNQLIQQSDKI